MADLTVRPSGGRQEIIIRSDISSSRRAVAIALVAALAFVIADLPTLAPTPPASAAASEELGPCTAGWQEWSVPESAYESTPFEILTVEGKPAWILGGTKDGVLVMSRRGSSWKHVAKGSRGHRGFVGGDALSTKEVLGAGYARVPELEFDPMVGSVTGSKLDRLPPPRVAGDASALADIVAAPSGRAWAVGTRLRKGKLMASASRWDGRRWTNDHPSSGSGAGLVAVDRTPNGRVWAVGWKERAPGRSRPLILERRANGWSESARPDLGGGSAVLTDIDFRTGRDGWTVGYRVGPGSDDHRVLLYHWDGTDWTDVELPWRDDFSALPRSISLGEDDEIWIGGTQLAHAEHEARGFIAHHSGGAWTISVVGLPDEVRSEITDVAATNSGAVAVGAIGGTALVLRTCESDEPTAGDPAGDDQIRRIEVAPGPGRRVAEVSADDDVATAQPSSTGPLAALTPVQGSAGSGFVVRDRSKRAGLPTRTSTYEGFAADLDGNGWEDVFFSQHAGKPPVLALNGPDGFQQATPGAFSIVDRHGCAAADVDSSGALDVLCAVGRGRGRQVTRHELSLDPSEPSAQLDRTGLGISDPLGRGRVVAFLDYDDDADPDVFIGSVPTRDDSLPGLNRFYRNDGGTFVPAPEVGLDRAHGAICAWSGDIDGDEDDDLVYCTKWRTGDGAAGLRIVRNEDGRLRDRTKALGVKPNGDVDVAFGDVTGDGRLDLIQLSKTRVRISKGTKKGYVPIWEAAISDAVAVAAGDANGDGRADLYIVRGTKQAQRPDRLLVSRDRGRRFASVPIPQAREGAADDVFSLDWDRNGLADFVVLNGRGVKGPVQLLASYRS